MKIRVSEDMPEDFIECVEFHGHLCPGLAIGYAAAKAGKRILSVQHAEDEEVVTVVENDSCAVDALQVILGCTFGKGNLIFRDWGKQVFTFIERKSGRAVRVSLKGDLPGRDRGRALKENIQSGSATDEEKTEWENARQMVITELVTTDPRKFFEISEIKCEMPPTAQRVESVPCPVCREAVVKMKMVELNGRLVCKQCAGL